MKINTSFHRFLISIIDKFSLSMIKKYLKKERKIELKIFNIEEVIKDYSELEEVSLSSAIKNRGGSAWARSELPRVPTPPAFGLPRIWVALPPHR